MLSFSYDANGNLATKRDNLGWVTTFAYNDVKRPVLKTYTNASGSREGVAAVSVSWAWDGTWKAGWIR